MKLAIIGATGLVGSTLLKVIEELKVSYTELILAASEKSVGKSIFYNDKEHHLVTIDRAIELKPDIAIFSAGSAPSHEYAPVFAKQGCFVIDNSSAWRMQKDVPLVVPEINASSIDSSTKIIANPNCSTIQMVMALAPLHERYGIQRIVVSTYQSVSGTGKKAIEQLMDERANNEAIKVYPHAIDLNCIPHGGTFLENGNTSEEEKLIHETRKILNDSTIQVSATVVRVPVIGGHSESVNLEFKKPFELSDIYSTLNKTTGITIQDDPQSNIYPMPLKAHNKNEVYLGRIRRDSSIKNGLNLWVVSDNLRKGAATNAIQIAQYLINNQLV